ncbi:MAG: helix-turn-helix domain-containing protein [Anaerolineae bacterium]|nr:helix-turn-helix domain-containing protein [Anaerolineae bacterium]
MRIGVQIEPNDSFWIQIEEALHQNAERLGDVELITIEVSDPLTTGLLDEHGGLDEELLAQDIQALICKDILPSQLPTILSRNIPTIYLAEADFEHPLFTSPCGLYEAARLVGLHLAEKLGGQGHILCVGGLVEPGADDGRTRLAGFYSALDAYPAIVCEHIPTEWRQAKAKKQLIEALQSCTHPIDAVFGLSDTIALVAREVLDEYGLSDQPILIAGINGDPLALAAIAKGKMALTVETPASEFADQALQLARSAAQGVPLPTNYRIEPHLITPNNVNDIALQKLIAIADIPSRLVGVNRRQEQNRLMQLETSAEISRHVGMLLDQNTLVSRMSTLIRANYGYDDVQILFWTAPEDQQQAGLDDQVLNEVLNTNAPVFIPNVYASHRYPPNPKFLQTLSRVALPIQLGDALVGILDLHSHQPTLHPRHELIGLQALANQLGIVMKNAQLYAEALDAKAQAERSDQLKTRLLANVSHELRTPLNVIIGYAQTALTTPDHYQCELSATLQRDLGYIAQSGEHLLHLINDLLSLSQAEIGALDIYKESIPTKRFLEDIFTTLATMNDKPRVDWKLNLPDQLPMIEADSVRLRQILLNLLNNARKFTDEGEVELGAEVTLPYLHLWIRDTGIGIPSDMQDRIFEPFVKIEQQAQRQAGAGLGLTIAQRLVTLHGGTMTLDSQIGQGSIFHIYLPMTDVAGQVVMQVPHNAESVLLVISNWEQPTAAINALCQRQQLKVHRLNFNDDLDSILNKVHATGLAWDISTATREEWALFERLREHPRLAQLPFIVYGQDQNPQKSRGLIDVLLKPISDKTLIGTLLALYPREERGLILIVDDDQNARALYSEQARRALPNPIIKSVESGAAALSFLEQETPSLVILDLMMADIDGFAVLERMRNNPKLRHIPVIVMSGRLLSSEDVRRLDFSNVSFQSKNLLTDVEMTNSLQELFSGSRGLSQPTSRLVKQALAYLHQNYVDATLSRQELASAIGTSKQHLDRIFSKEMKLSVIDYLNRFRVERAKEYLDSTANDITIIASQVGFNDSAYFSRVFRKVVGTSPRAYRRGD